MRLPKALLQAITFPIIPPMSDGSCGCGNRECPNAGKHPACKWGAKSLAPGQSVPIPEGFNAGLATGARSNCIVIDLDRKNGVDGLIALMALGVISVETLAACTPSGGYHLYFRHPGVHIPNSASLLGPGIDVRGDGGYVVLPGSRHKNGGLYTWVDENVEIADCPAWLLEHILNPSAKSRIVKRETLERIAKIWKRSKSVYKQELGVALLAVCKGESFADAGSRDTTLWQIASELPKQLPDADLGKLAELFVPSLDLMEREAPEAPSVDDVAEKLSRAYGEVQAAAGGAWTSRLAVNSTGGFKACLSNVNIVLASHPALAGLIVYDERRGRELLTREPPWSTPEEKPAPRDVSDADAIHFTTWLSENMRMETSDIICRTAINGEAQLHSFDKVREMLLNIELAGWDDVPRLDKWLVDYAGAEDTQYVRAVSSKFVISAIARALDPGCKVDTMLILEGLQGKFKSMLLRALAGGKEYFSDNLPDLESKDAMDHIRGPWIVEIKELEAFNRTRTTAIKGWLDCQDDRFRPAYGSKTIDFPRRCVFAGTTNSRAYLKDPTGNRRFWPVWITKCLIKAFKLVRDQIIAEAIARYRAGGDYCWWLSDEEVLLAGEEQEKREEEEDSWLPTIVTALEMGAVTLFGAAPKDGVPTNWAIQPRTDHVTVGTILEHVLRVPNGQQDRRHQMRVAAILTKIGWVRKFKMIFGVRTWAYFRPTILRLVKDGER